jgi:hypothetical protein
MGFLYKMVWVSGIKLKPDWFFESCPDLYVKGSSLLEPFENRTVPKKCVGYQNVWFSDAGTIHFRD